MEATLSKTNQEATDIALLENFRPAFCRSLWKSFSYYLSNCIKMECVLGISCNDFVILASDMTNAHSIIVNKQGLSALYILDNELSNVLI